MTRRQILKQIAVLLGGAISPPVVSAALSGSRPVAGAEAWQPRTLSADQNRLVTALAELILPATDTPGAMAAGVNEFIDLLLTDWLSDGECQRFLAGLADLDASSRAQFDRAFLELTAAEQMSLLEPLDVESVDARVAAARSGLQDVALPFFGMMKEMTIVGYYTSEVGIEHELEYDPYPGAYAGCVPFEDAGRTRA
ncbi:MAG: gluconate 2-dehydrogenase subunit 3 family protein [Acidobacteriota bacterium]|nr:gluconate 2-dehydrogenase subunit 3 family protein [Acidobacteriota bacterium]